MRVDDVEQVRGQRLAAAVQVVGAFVEVVVDQAGVKRHGRARGRARVVAGLRGDDAARLLAELVVVEELAERAHAPGDHGRRSQREAQVVQARARNARLAQLRGDRLQRAQTAGERVGLRGEGGEQAVGVVRPALRDADLATGEAQGVKPAGVHLEPIHPALQPDAAQDRGDLTRVHAAHVVQAHVELPLPLAPEHLAAAARHVVLLADEHPLAVRG